MVISEASFIEKLKYIRIGEITANSGKKLRCLLPLIQISNVSYFCVQFPIIHPPKRKFPIIHPPKAQFPIIILQNPHVPNIRLEVHTANISVKLAAT